MNRTPEPPSVLNTSAFLQKLTGVNKDLFLKSSANVCCVKDKIMSNLIKMFCSLTKGESNTVSKGSCYQLYRSDINLSLVNT